MRRPTQLLAAVLSCSAFAAAGGFAHGPKLVGWGAVGNALQGASVALSADGSTLIVGGPEDNGGNGAAWVFTRSDGVWTQQGAKLVGTGAVNPAHQGQSVALSSDGNTALVGGPNDNGNAGAAWVFTRGGGVWTQQGPKLVGSGAVSGTPGGVQQGSSVALSSDGNTAIVGGPYDGFADGAAWVFTRSGTVWMQQGAKLFGTGATGSAQQGRSVALSGDGNTAIVGGPDDYYEFAAGYKGAAWVFTRSAGTWTQQAKLVGSLGWSLYDQDPSEGWSVALAADGNTAIVGGPDFSQHTGAAWVFTRSGGAWGQNTKLAGTDAVSSARQGISVALSSDGNTAIIGGPAEGPSGAAWVFTRSGGGWTQQGAKLVGPGAAGSPQEGESVALASDGNTLILGGLTDNAGGGAVWVFDRLCLSGDLNGDGVLDVGDVFYLINFLFAGGPAPACS